MQDIHTLPTGVGDGGNSARLFGDRRLRQHGGSHPNNQQCLKCPRCDSLNTKFCYYNNYNLSQPRYFCKNCRRYWTKGGVLRNVPVGGGCRKSKRSSRPKPKQQTNSSSEDKVGLQSHSSSESSNNTNTTTTSNTNTATTTTAVTTQASVVTAPGASYGSSGIFQISDADLLSIRNLDPLMDTPGRVGDNDSGGGGGGGGDGHILCPVELSGFMGLMNNNNNNNNCSNNHVSTSGCFEGVDGGNGTTSFGQFMNSQATVDWEFGRISGTHHEVEDMDPRVRMDDLLENRESCGGLTTLDWHENGHHGLFDLSSAVDHQTYWSHEVTTTTDQHRHRHWSDNASDHSFSLP